MLRKILEEFFNSTYKYNLDKHIDDAMKKIEELFPEKKDVKKGSGYKCKCFAYDNSECGCGADWTDYKQFNKAIDQVKERLGI